MFSRLRKDIDYLAFCNAENSVAFLGIVGAFAIGTSAVSLPIGNPDMQSAYDSIRVICGLAGLACVIVAGIVWHRAPVVKEREKQKTSERDRRLRLNQERIRRMETLMGKAWGPHAESSGLTVRGRDLWSGTGTDMSLSLIFLRNMKSDLARSCAVPEEDWDPVIEWLIHTEQIDPFDKVVILKGSYAHDQSSIKELRAAMTASSESLDHANLSRVASLLYSQRDTLSLPE